MPVARLFVNEFRTLISKLQEPRSTAEVRRAALRDSMCARLGAAEPVAVVMRRLYMLLFGVVRESCCGVASEAGSICVISRVPSSFCSIEAQASIFVCDIACLNVVCERGIKALSHSKTKV